MSEPEHSRRTPPASSLQRVGCVLLVVVLGAILVWLCLPQISDRPLPGHVIQTLNNGRQIYLATFNMVNDGLETKDPKFGWPGDLAASKVDPITSLGEFVNRLVEHDYIKKADIGKIFAAPGVRAYTGQGEFTGENSAFKIYKVRESDLASVIFSATKNFTFGRGLDKHAVPDGDKSFCVVRKGGDASPYFDRRAALNTNLGLMPGHSDMQNPGAETKDSILSM
jgi:hypothetical protein